MTAIPEDACLVADAVAEAGVTYRQADFWIRSGHIQARSVVRQAMPDGTDQLVFTDNHGSGYLRVLLAEDRATLTLMGRLTRAGFTPQAAAEIAHAMVATPGEPVELSGQLAIADLSSQ